MANASVIYGWWPRSPKGDTFAAPPRQPKAMLKGGKSEKGELEFDWKGSVGSALQSGGHSGSVSWTASDLKYKAFKSINYEPTPVCVWPPFIWIVSNNTGNITELCACPGGRT